MARTKRRQNYTARDIITGNIGMIFSNNMAYILFIAFLITIYIANAHYAEGKVREIQTTQEEVQYLNWQYMEKKSELMKKSIESEVTKLVDNQNLDPANTPAYKIKVND